MTLRGAGETFALYNRHLKEIPGFLTRRQALIWGFLLEFQVSSGIEGNLAEIGVYEGRSAVLLAAWERPGEMLTLIDPYHSAELSARIEAAAPGASHTFHALSSEDPAVTRAIASLARSVRFFHIDGRHSAHCVRHELDLADTALAARGLVCVDDFFSDRYPEVTLGVFDFLRDRPGAMKIVLCAFNKCFLCRAEAHQLYLDALGGGLIPMMREHGFVDFTLFRSNDAGGLDCHSIGRRLGEHDTYGPD